MTTAARSADPELSRALAELAARFPVPVGHHVASPLGAWLLLAFVGRFATGERRARLERWLGMDADRAFATATRLADERHPAIGLALAAWSHDQLAQLGLGPFFDALPASVARGPVPDQQHADEWASDRTSGLIARFPLDLKSAPDLLLASALATKVAWRQPFDIAGGTELGQSSAWSHLERVLTTTRSNAHGMWIVRTAGAGDVAVHAAYADGLAVVSVIAAPDVQAHRVVPVAHDLAVSAARGEMGGAVSLFELALGETPIWRITEHEIETIDDERERFRVTMPAWSAFTNLDLSATDIGFDDAAHALMALAHLPMHRFQVRQSAMARFHRLGFEAAAVTAFGVTGSGLMRQSQRVRIRTAFLRFGHPYAVVAVATSAPRWNHESKGPEHGPWHTVPAFNAWVTEPEEAELQGWRKQPDEWERAELDARIVALFFRARKGDKDAMKELERLQSSDEAPPTTAP